MLPSDSMSPWTPLHLARCFPLLGRTRDFNPLEFAHAGQTKNTDWLAPDGINEPDVRGSHYFFTILFQPARQKQLHRLRPAIVRSIRGCVFFRSRLAAVPSV